MPEVFKGRRLEQSGHGHKHYRRQHRLRQVAQQMREKEDHHQHDACRDRSRKGRSGAAALVDQGLGHAAAYRKAPAQAGGEIGRGKRQEFLVGIEPSAMLGCEGAANGGCFRCAKEETGEGERQQRVQIRPVNRRKANGRQALAVLRPAAFTPRASSPSRAEAIIPPTTTNRATGLFLRKIFPRMSTASAMPPTIKGRGIGFRQVLEEIAAVLPEIAVRAMDAKQFRQLGAGEEQGHPAS